MILKHKWFYQQFVDIHIVQKVCCCCIFFIHKIATFLLQKLNINWNEHPLPLPITMILTLRLNTISFKELGLFYTFESTFTMWSLLLHGLNFTVYVDKMVSNFFFFIKLFKIDYSQLWSAVHFFVLPIPRKSFKKIQKKEKAQSSESNQFLLLDNYITLTCCRFFVLI